MMYSDRFVVAVKVSGQILRENKDSVRLPFGSEYSIFLKNLNSVRTQVKVSVDGEDAAGTLVVAPNGDMELERFIRNGNLESGNRFKFIERTSAIEAHRGVKADDGLIRVEYQFERPQPEITERIIRDRHVPMYRPPLGSYPRIPMRFSSYRGVPPLMRPRPMGASSRRPMHATRSASAPGMDSARRQRSLRSPFGITVAGSESNQKFIYVSGFPLEANSHVIVLRLMGMMGKLPITKAVTVKEKLQCSTCGRKNKSGSNCCSECGTALVLI